MQRRNFIKTTAAMIAGGCLVPRVLTGKSNKSHLETLRVAVVGFGGRGKSLTAAVNACANAQIVAYADVDEKILGSHDAKNVDVERVTDFRRLLDRKDIDVIVSATPNHWHALLTILACQAGKHVYIEKPISHNMFESAAVVAAADRYKKIVQCGFQNRSDTAVFPFFDRLRSGELGTVTSVHGTCHRPRNSIGKNTTALVPAKHIDFNLWLGPAADQPIYRPRLHYDWHWDFNTGNGDVGNQGPHEWDMMNWALGDTDELPSSIKSCGNRFGWNDAGNTPNVMAVSGTMNRIPFVFEVMDLRPGVAAPFGCGVGVIVETDKGRFVGGRDGGKFTWNDGKTEVFKRVEKQNPTFDHMQNFVDGVFANDRGQLKSDCKVAAKSASMAHMANISYRLGQQMTASDAKTAFVADERDEQLMTRMMEAPEIYHQKHGSEPLDWVVGPGLSFDHASQQFTGQSAGDANALMKRKYRSGFEIPKLS